MEASKAAFIKWYPTYQSYHNAGGAKSLQQCMDPIVQNAFKFLLPNLKKDRILFFTSSSPDLYTAIQKLYRLSTIASYKSLLTNIYMAKSDIFNHLNISKAVFRGWCSRNLTPYITSRYLG